MEWTKNITDVLNSISSGVDPSTGEIIDAEILKNDPGFQQALIALQRRYGKARSGGAYARFETEYPHYAIIMTEGYFYTAHNKSAFILSKLLGYRLILDSFKRPTTGGPSYDKIKAALLDDGIGFLLVSKGSLIEKFDGDDPFEKYEITDEVCAEAITREMQSFGLSAPSSSSTLAESIDSKLTAYPFNLLNALLPELSSYQGDIETRIANAVSSPVIFSANYRRDAECLVAYYKSGSTLEQIGSVYGVSKERIRQIISRAMKKLHRKAVISYLKGETESLEVSKPHQKSDRSEPVFATDSALINLSPVTADSVSISELARRLSENTSYHLPRKLRYDDIASWMIETGDLMKSEEAGKAAMIPTHKGESHGIKRGKRVNSKGIEYIGVFLEHSAQEYVTENLDSIRVFMDPDNRS